MLRNQWCCGSSVVEVYRGKRTVMRNGLAAMIAGAVLSGVVSADTLAQPQVTALEDRAASYVQFREDVATIESTPMKSAEATRDAHKRLAAHDPSNLSSGWVAYAALVAAQTPEFSAALKEQVKSSKRFKGTKQRGRNGFFATLSQDPSYPRKLKGASAAIDRVLAMTASDTSRVTALGEEFKSQAYSMQKTNWGKKRIANGSKRVNEASQFAAARPQASSPGIETKTNKGVTTPTLASGKDMWSPDWGAEGASFQVTEKNAQVIIDRVLNLAARYSLGGMNEKVVEVYSKNNKSQQCLSMAKLTLAQCIAASRTPYEEAFCLGEHGLGDMGTCVGWVAGAS